MNDSAFSSYRSGYIIKSVPGNKINFKKIVARYIFNDDSSIFSRCITSEDIEIAIKLSNEISTSKTINYAIKTMSLILGTNLNIKIDIADRRKEKDEYELFVSTCLAINEMLESPINKNQLLSKVISASNLDKDLIKEKYALIKLDQLTKWSIEEEYIKLEKNSILDKISSFKTANLKAVKVNTSSRIDANNKLNGVYKCLFTVDEE